MLTRRETILLWAAASALCVAGAFRQARTWSIELAKAEGPRDGFIRRDQAARRGGAAPSGQTFQKIQRGAGGVDVLYGFVNFNHDALWIKAPMADGAVREAMGEFGYSDRDLDAIDQWYQAAQREAQAQARENMKSGRVSAPSQAELDRKLAQIKQQHQNVRGWLDRRLDEITREYRGRREKLYSDRGYKLAADNNLVVDIPKLSVRNRKRMREAAGAIYSIAQQKGYGAPETIGAITSMVQTSMEYRIPPDTEGGRYLTGVYPPPRAFAEGWGDCDTKTALIASLLGNWNSVKMVGVAIPKHYLIAVHQYPQQGDAFVEYQGLPYVLIEASGPAWLPPGQVGDTTRQFLQSGGEFELEQI